MSAVMKCAANGEKLDAALARVAAIDLDRIEAKLQSKLGWTPERAAEAVEMYRRYLALLVLDPTQMLAPPSQDADEVWHAHILDTPAYHQDCADLFGVYLHHVPSYGTPQDRVKMAASRERTELVFQTHFGTPGDKVPAAGCVPCLGQPTAHKAEENNDRASAADAGCVPCFARPTSREAETTEAVRIM